MWLLGYLKNNVYQGNIGNLADLKSQILLHAHNISSDQIHAAVDHAITQCYMLVLKQDKHIENRLQMFQSSVLLYYYFCLLFGL